MKLLNSPFLKKVGGKAVMLWRRHGSTIMTVTGCASTVAGTFFACKATLKVDAVLKKREEDLARIEGAHNGTLLLTDGAEYTDQDYKKDLLTVKTAAAKDLVKLYFPAGALIIGGIALIGGGHRMIRNDLIATAANAAALKQSFDNYRDRVKAKLGEEDEELVYRDISKVEVTNVGPETDNKPVTKSVYVGNGETSPYIRYFDETNPYWTGREDYDFTFLKQRQAELNHLLNENGYLFWNVQLEKLGFEPVIAGQVAGNIISDKTDGFVDFGVFDMRNGTAKQWAIDMYRNEHRIMVDFNVDGNIIEYVEKKLMYI